MTDNTGHCLVAAGTTRLPVV